MGQNTPSDREMQAQRLKIKQLGQEVYAQDGCLTETELTVMLKISHPTVGIYLREYEAEHKTVLPQRGTIHDMGPTLPHKKNHHRETVY